MYTFAKNGEVWWPVTVTTTDDNGGFTDSAFVCLFKVRSRAERRTREKEITAALLKKAKGAKSTEDLEKLAHDLEERQLNDDADLVNRVRGWKQLVDGEAADVPFNKQNLKALLDNDAVCTAMSKSFEEACRGAKAKN